VSVLTGAAEAAGPSVRRARGGAAWQHRAALPPALGLGAALPSQWATADARRGAGRRGTQPAARRCDAGCRAAWPDRGSRGRNRFGA